MRLRDWLCAGTLVDRLRMPLIAYLDSRGAWAQSLGPSTPNTKNQGITNRARPHTMLSTTQAVGRDSGTGPRGTRLCRQPRPAGHLGPSSGLGSGLSGSHAFLCSRCSV